MSNKIFPKRKQLRLKGCDYSEPGAYFVTICTQERVCLFGDVTDGEMQLNDAGQMVQSVWDGIVNLDGRIQTDAFVIMPNHVHGIVLLVGAPLVGARESEPNTVHRAGTRPAPTLGAVVGAFKSMTTHEYVQGVKKQNWPPFSGKLWQRDYYERVIRNEEELFQIRQYIQENPLKWDLDPENPNRKMEAIPQNG